MYVSIYLYIYNTIIAIYILDDVILFARSAERMHRGAARRSCGQLVQRGGF